MFDTSNYLHYVLDSATDYHYTDDLMRLSPDAYLWHELKERQGFEYVIFVKKNDSGFVLELYDSASRELLDWSAKKSFFSKHFSPSVPVQLRHSTRQLKDIGKQDSTLLEFLLNVQQNARSEKTALVFSPEAFCSAVEAGGESPVALMEYIRRKISNGIAIIQVDMTAEALRQVFLKEECLFTELDPDVRKVLRSNICKPLLTALSEQLGDRLLDFSTRQNDMLNMLMFEALESGNCQDSTAQLKDQAEYLRLCCDYDLNIAYMLGSAGSEPRRRSVIYGKLQETTFRNALRSGAEQLRQTNPEALMEYLFRAAYSPLPEISLGQRVRFNDSLVKSVTALSLPEEYIQYDSTLRSVPQELLKSVRTLWNRKRNPVVCTRIEEYCGILYSAAVSKNWDTVTDALLMLGLCARYLCADTTTQCNLEEVFRLGNTVLTDGAKLFTAQKSFQSMEKLKKAGSGMSEIAHMHDSIYSTMDSVNLEAELIMLQIHRHDLHQCLKFFDINTHTQKEIEDFFRDREKSQQEAMLQLQGKKKQVSQYQKTAVKPEEDIDDTPPEPVSTPRRSASHFWDDGEDDTPEEPQDRNWLKGIGHRAPWEDDPLLQDSDDEPIEFS